MTEEAGSGAAQRQSARVPRQVVAEALSNEQERNELGWEVRDDVRLPVDVFHPEIAWAALTAAKVIR